MATKHKSEMTKLVTAYACNAMGINLNETADERMAREFVPKPPERPKSEAEIEKAMNLAQKMTQMFPDISADSALRRMGLSDPGGNNQKK